MKSQPSRYVRFACQVLGIKPELPPKPLPAQVPKPWPLQSGEPWLCHKAIAQLEDLVVPGTRILEWGSGGSTIFFAKRGAKIHCVEHDPEWARLVKRELVHRKLGGQVNIHEIDLGSDYVSIVDQLIGDFDLIIVDGRQRVECVKRSNSRLVPGGWILLDDSDRENYWPAYQELAGWKMMILKGSRTNSEEQIQSTMWQRPDQSSKSA